MVKWMFWKKDPRANHAFDEQDRALAAERRRINTELENMKKRQEMERLRAEHELEMARIQEELNEYADDDDDEPSTVEDEMAKAFLNRIMAAPAAASAAAPGSMRAYSDEELRAKLAQVSPQHIALAKSCTAEQVAEFIKARVLPDADDDSISRATALVRTAS